MKYLSLFVSIVALVSLALVSTAAAEDYRVGVLLPLSGEHAHIGEACRNGMTMAVEELGDEGKNLKLLYEDDQINPRLSVSAFNKLTNLDKIDMAVSFSSSTSKALGPIADARKIPLIAIASDKGVVDGRTHVVNLWVTPEEQAKLLVKEIEKRGYKRIARISAMHNATEAFRRAFDAENKGQIKVGLDDDYLMDTKDFKPFLIRLKQQKDVDAVFVNLFFGQVGTFAKQAKELGVTLPLFGIETFEDANEVKNSNGGLIGQWYIQADDGTEDFLARYAKRFPKASTYTSVNCYDAVLLAAEAMKKNFKSKQFVEFLTSVKDFPGAGGKFSATGDRRFTLPAVVKKVTEEGFVEISG